MTRFRLVPALLALGWKVAVAGGGPLGIDHEVGYDQSGIWARKYQTALQFGAIATEIGGALWLGNDDRLGHAFWQAIDASVISGAAAIVLKKTTGRARPSQSDDPNRWFRGSCCESFPSGEVTLQASFVTPLIVNYAHEHPWIWALEILPVYDATARLKSHAHWQTDVIAGWALGTAVGYWSAKRDIPLSVQILPDGVSVGLSKRF
jgi:membrane-associated phospholipid phosphatase